MAEVAVPCPDCREPVTRNGERWMCGCGAYGRLESFGLTVHGRIVRVTAPSSRRLRRLARR